jgi:class 3 adenylate cyclase
LSSTRRQARLLAAHLPDAGNIVPALGIPPVVAFTGHMLDEPGRAVPRLPAMLEGRVREALRERLERLAPLALYGSAACGVDLLCLEEARALGAETHVILPFPAADFRRASVDFAGASWGKRFEDALAAAASVTVTSDHHARGSSATFEYANLVLTGMARLRARTLDAPLRGLAAWDPRDSGARGGAASIVALWRAGDVQLEEIDIGALRGQTPAPRASALAPTPSATPPTRHELRAMLFADAVGYSKLSEDQIPGYISGFLGAVAAHSRSTAHRFEHVETSGDGLYMVFRDVDDAARYALELSALANDFDRESCGLPASFNLRIALHCGPVHCGIDPITGLPIYTGPHTSRTARIEPITPPGHVYASSAFAAVAAARNLPIAMTYVGRMPLAKGYGFLGLYHLRGGNMESSLRRFDPQLAGA